LLLMMVLMAFMVGRLMWIQLFSASKYSGRGVNLVENSVSQRKKSLVLHSGRANFYDQSLRPITGQTIHALVVFPNQEPNPGSAHQVAELARILGVEVSAWKAFFNQVTEPKLWSKDDGNVPESLSQEQTETIKRLQLPYVQVVDYETRYPSDMAAGQLIGFIGEHPDRIRSFFADDLARGEVTLASRIGEAGLEKTFESAIRGIGETSISYFIDNNGKRPLEGLGIRMLKPDNPNYPLKVITTLNLNLQQQIEALMESMHILEGSVVVLDAAQGDIKAMASRPAFHPDEVASGQSHWSNHALKAMVPGSIFKTVVAAAALEEGIVKPDETFHCEGALGKYGFTCWNKHGHGYLTLEEGFAQSCNIVFAKVMQRISPAKLDAYTEDLGLIRQVGWTGNIGQQRKAQLDSEDRGQLFAPGTNREDEGVRMQTAIGQRDVRLTPLQAANMVVTLLHRGERYSPRAVSEIRFQTDRIMTSFPIQKERTSLSRSTCQKLLQWMERVVEDGTGRGLQAAKWQLAGKSGTAQVQTGKQEKLNQWFIGYGPVQWPRYAVSVVVENAGPQEANKGIPLFKGIMQILANAK
jgi:cell division protein FtsI/penicillin-binding protein 2